MYRMPTHSRINAKRSSLYLMTTSSQPLFALDFPNLNHQTSRRKDNKKRHILHTDFLSCLTLERPVGFYSKLPKPGNSQLWRLHQLPTLPLAPFINKWCCSIPPQIASISKISVPLEEHVLIEVQDPNQPLGASNRFPKINTRI